MSLLGAGVLLAAAGGALTALVSLDAVLSNEETLGVSLLGLGLAGALIGLRATRAQLLSRPGPGLAVSGFVLSFAFLAGIYLGKPQLEDHRAQIALLLGLSVVGLLVGGVSTAAFRRSGNANLEPAFGPNVLQSRLFKLAFGLCLTLALVNLATGGAHLLASNVNAARFSGSKGAFGNVLDFVIGGLEWAAVLSAVMVVRRKRVQRGPGLIFVAATMPLILLAGRSFLVLIALSVLVAVAVMYRIKLSRLAIIVLIGIVALGVAGQYRTSRSGVTGNTGGLQSEVFGSAGIGLTVFASTLDEVPRDIGYQHGAFILMDLRADFPLHPFGRPLTSDYWVTEFIRLRNPDTDGGSPPTLAGGLYIDFGSFGVLIGTLMIGALLALLYGWMLRARTMGSVVLYSYASAYVALSAYSYISLKVTVLWVFALAVLLHAWEVRTAPGDRAFLRA